MANGNPLRYERLRGLIKTVEKLAGTNDLHDAVDIIRTSARRLIGADGITVILRDGDECHYVEEDAIGPLWKGQNFPMDSCVSGWAMRRGETAVIADITQDVRVPLELYADTFVGSMAMAPIRRDNPVGAIGAYWSEAHHPSPDAVEALEIIAGAVGTSIENARLLSAMSDALAEAENSRDELRHRIKNAFAVAQALASLSLPQGLAGGFVRRLRALARAYELIDARLARDASITLIDLVKGELGAYLIEAPDRIEIEGPPLRLPSQKAIALGIALNELATNALKYGALSRSSGRVSVQWLIEDDQLVVQWEERGGPGVQAAAVESFGSRMLRRVIEGQLGGNLTRQLRRDGVFCTFEIPGIAGASAPA